MEGNWCSTRFHVRYAETDAAGIVHHSAYIVWFEEGRSELSRRLGMPYAELERRGIDLVLTSVEGGYRAPPPYDQEVEVQTHVVQLLSLSPAF